MKILVLGSGSSFIKFKLFDNKIVLASDLVERTGDDQSKVGLKNARAGTKIRRDTHIGNHEKGLRLVEELFNESGVLKDLNELDGYGHRIIHGGKNLTEHCLANDFMLKEIGRVDIIIPPHNPARLAGIKTILKAAPKVPNAAIFGTVFHRSMPDYAYMYTLPYDYYTEYNIRKYGFHGTSHFCVSSRAAILMQKESISAISTHLGNGASMCAIENGKSIDTSMGFTPLEGLIMRTRCGDIDPATLPFIAKTKNLNANELDTMMSKRNGLYGVCGYDNFRDVVSEIRSGDSLARLTLDMYRYRLAKYIDSYFAVLSHTDALIFTAGVGENTRIVRRKAYVRPKRLSFELDDSLNENDENGGREISKASSRMKIFVIPTDEELEIAKITEELIKET